MCIFAFAFGAWIDQRFILRMQIHALRLTVSSDVLERVVLAFTFAKQQLCVFTLCACFEGMLWNDIISFFGIVGYVPHHLGLLFVYNE